MNHLACFLSLRHYTAVKTKFMGNWVDVWPTVGRCKFEFDPLVESFWFQPLNLCSDKIWFQAVGLLSKYIQLARPLYTTGRTRIHLKRTGEVFNIIPPASRINNVVVGSMWIDTFGEMRVENLATGAAAKLDFKVRRCRLNTSG